MLALLLAAGGAGCAVKVKKERIAVLPAVANAKTLRPAEVVALFHEMCQRHQTILVRNASLVFIGESGHTHRREKLPSANGILALTRDGDLRLQILTPLIKTTAADVVAKNGRFEIWFPRRQTLYTGSVAEDLQHLDLGEEYDDEGLAPRYNLTRLRPWHITNTFFLARLDETGGVMVIEEDTPRERYYVVHELSSPVNGNLALLQKVWIERSTLQVRRKVLYAEHGVPVSDIVYHRYTDLPSGPVPIEISMHRPVEGYRIHFTVKTVAADIPLRDDMFQLNVPDKARLVEIKPKEQP